MNSLWLDYGRSEQTMLLSTILEFFPEVQEAKEMQYKYWMIILYHYYYNRG